MDYYSALCRSGKILESYFEQSKDIFHSGSKGMIRENIINKIIRPFLPFCYGISGGEAFDKKGQVSKQLDIVIYDSIFSYIIPYVDNFIQFPCESVYGNIEVKSYLNGDELNKAVDNIASLKRLSRLGTHSWQVTPKVSIQINGLPNERNRNPYFGIIFAYDSVEVETLLRYIKDLTIPPQLLPNAIVLYNKQTLIIQAKDTKIEAYPVDVFNKYAVLNCGDDILAIFIGLLINYTRYSLLSVADISRDIVQVLEKTLFENIKNHTNREIELNCQESF